MNTVNSMAPAVGQIISIRLEQFIVEVQVVDVKSSYGNTLFLVRPIKGDGEAWIGKSRIVLAA